LTFDEGVGKSYTVKESIFTVLCILAVRIWIHGHQNRDVTMEKAVREAVYHLHKKNDWIYCHCTMRRLLALYWFEVDSVDEFQILENLGKLFISLGVITVHKLY